MENGKSTTAAKLQKDIKNLVNYFGLEKYNQDSYILFDLKDIILNIESDNFISVDYDACGGFYDFIHFIDEKRKSLNKTINYNPNKKNISLNFKDVSDFIAACEKGLAENYSIYLLQDFTKTKTVENVFFIKNDQEPEQLGIKTQKNKKYKYIRISEKYYTFVDYIKNVTVEKIFDQISDTGYQEKTFNTTLIEKDNSYFIVSVDNDSGRSRTTEISNFTLELMYISVDNSLRIPRREFIFNVKNNQEKEAKVILKSTEWGNFNKFKETMWNFGQFLFEGSNKDFIKMQSFIIQKYEEKIINNPDCIGKIDSDTWIFNEGLIYKGVFIPFDLNGIAYIDNAQTIGYTLQNKKSTENKIVSFMSNIDIDVKELFGKFFSIYGEDSYKMFGFAVSTIFSDDIFKKYNENPILFNFGKSGSGKTSAAELLSSLLGKSEVKSISSTTKGLSRTLAKNKNLPIIIDESCDSEDKIKQADLDNFFINAYNKTGYTRASKSNDNETNTSEINASVIYASEFFPNREAVINRSVLCDFNKIIPNAALFNEIYNNKYFYSNFLIQILRKINKKDVLKEIDQLCNVLYKKYSNNFMKRIIDNHAIFYGSFIALSKSFGILDTEIDCFEWIENKLKSDMEKVSNVSLNSNVYNQFFEHLQHLLNDENERDYLFYKEGKTSLCFSLYHTYNKIMEVTRNTKDFKAKKNDIQAFLESQLNIKQKSIRIPGDQSKVIKGYEIPIHLLVKNQFFFEEKREGQGYD